MPPQVLIEDAILECVPAVRNAVVVGEGKKYLSCLLTLKLCGDGDPASVPGQALAQQALQAAVQAGSSAATVAEAKR